MILDLILGFWLIGAGLMGFRDGIVRKVVSIVMTIVALLLGQMLMRDAGDLLIETAGVDPADAPMQGFLAVFILILMIQSLLYRFATDAYKIGGILDRVAGSGLGVVHGVVFISAFLFIMSMTGFPSRSFKRDSRIYKGIVNVAPQIMDMVLNVGPDSMERFKEITTPEGATTDPRTNQPAPLRRTSPEAERRARMIDSLRALQRR